MYVYVYIHIYIYIYTCIIGPSNNAGPEADGSGPLQGAARKGSPARRRLQDNSKVR